MQSPQPSSASQAGPSLRLRTSRAAMASLASELAGRGLMVALTIATARALEPSEVGVLGIATIVVGILTMFAVYGETAGIIAAGETDHRAYAMTAFLLRAGVTVLVVAVAWALEPALVAWLTRSEDQATALPRLLRVLFAQLAAEALGTYPRVWLQRSLALVAVTMVNLFAMALHVGLSIALLASGCGAHGVVWSYVVASLAASAAFWIVLVRRGGGLPDGPPSAAVGRGVLRDAAKLAAGGFVGYLNCRLDNLLVSATLGPAAMSYYGMAWNAARTPSSIVGRSASFVVVPTVARLQGERPVVERGLRDAVWYAYALLAPLCAVLYIEAAFLVETVLGTKWLPVVPILHVMCMTVLVTPLIEISNALLTAVGKAHLSGIATALQLATIVIGIPVLCRSFGLSGAAYADLASAVVDTIALGVTARLALPGLRWLSAAAIAGPLLAALAATFAGILGGAWLSHPVTRAATEIAVLAVTYPLGLWLLCGGERVRDSVAMLGGVLGLRPTPLPTR